MNRISLDNFQTEINQIREYLRHIEYVNKIIAYPIIECEDQDLTNILTNFQQHSKSFRIYKKEFEYKSTIISLYGLLEKYIEIWIKRMFEKSRRYYI